MIQQYEKYSKEDFEVWKILFDRQKIELSNKAAQQYKTCLDELNINLYGDEIPNFDNLNKVLNEKTGWTIEVVPGLIPVEDFFELLSRKKFCSSTWIRKKSQLDYLEEPDMFHDIFGHVPLLMDPDYADYMQEIGKLGVHHKGKPKIINGLKSLYWFTIEFGLLGNTQNPQIYGAGIISSYGESKHIYESKNIEIREFDLDEILQKEIVTSEIQNLYYTINSFDFLYSSNKELSEKLELIDSEINQINKT